MHSGNRRPACNRENASPRKELEERPRIATKQRRLCDDDTDNEDDDDSGQCPGSLQQRLDVYCPRENAAVSNLIAIPCTTMATTDARTSNSAVAVHGGIQPHSSWKGAIFSSGKIGPSYPYAAAIQIV